MREAGRRKSLTDRSRHKQQILTSGVCSLLKTEKFSGWPEACFDNDLYLTARPRGNMLGLVGPNFQLAEWVMSALAE